MEEDVIVKHVFDLNARAFPPRMADVEAMANLLRATRHALSVGTRYPSERVRPRNSSHADQSSKLAGIAYTTTKGLNAKMQN
jgi:hypothetical protein